MPLEGHDKLCFYCGELCDSLTGNPGLWPVCLPQVGEAKWHHTKCVKLRLTERDRLREALQNWLNARGEACNLGGLERLNNLAEAEHGLVKTLKGKE